MSPASSYSNDPLLRLFKERYWVDPGVEPVRAGALEKEIQERCRHIRERIRSRRSATEAESNRRFRPYGLISGVALLLVSVGPFALVQLLASAALIHDGDGERLILSGVWALLTLPALVAVFTLGGIMDAERIVKWFDLAGAQALGRSDHRQVKN